MKAAGLKAIDTVVESTATLIKSKHPSNQKLVDKIASRISGVISKFPAPLPSPLPIPPTTTKAHHHNYLSRPKVHPLSIQHRPVRSRNRHEDHAREARTYHHRSRGSGMGGCQFDGAEGEHSDGHGRTDGLWGDGYLSAQYSQFENRMIENPPSTGAQPNQPLTIHPTSLTSLAS